MLFLNSTGTVDIFHLAEQDQCLDPGLDQDQGPGPSRGPGPDRDPVPGPDQGLVVVGGELMLKILETRSLSLACLQGSLRGTWKITSLRKEK